MATWDCSYHGTVVKIIDFIVILILEVMHVNFPFAVVHTVTIFFAYNSYLKLT